MDPNKIAFDNMANYKSHKGRPRLKWIDVQKAWNMVELVIGDQKLVTEQCGNLY